MKYIYILFIVVSFSILLVIVPYIGLSNDYNYLFQTANLESNITSLYSKSFGVGIYVASLFYDPRISKIVINSPRHTKTIPLIPCTLVFPNENIQNCVVYEDNATEIEPRETFLLINITSEVPSKVILNNHTFPIFPYYKQHIKYQRTMCICKMVNISSVNRMIQTIESYILFGVDHFTFYKSSCSNEVEKVLQYYENKKLLDVITWDDNVDVLLFKNPTYGQTNKLYDCTYRHQYDSEYVIITDLDEIIWPMKGNTIKEMLDSYGEKYDVYYFKQRFYHQEWLDMFDRYVHNISDTDQFFYQEYCNYKGGQLQKQIYNPRTVIYPSIHYVKKGIDGFVQKWVSLEYAYTRHTRRIRKDHLFGCESGWLISQHDPREEIIQQKVKEVENELNIHPILKLEKIIFGNDSKYVYSE